MRGHWIGLVALACCILTFPSYRFVGLFPAFILAGAGVYLGKLGLDSKGRGASWVALILGLVLVGVILTVLIVGKENIGIDPA